MFLLTSNQYEEWFNNGQKSTGNPTFQGNKKSRLWSIEIHSILYTLLPQSSIIVLIYTIIDHQSSYYAFTHQSYSILCHQPSINHHQSPIINHQSSSITNHQSSIIINHHQSSSIINHTRSSIINHQSYSIDSSQDLLYILIP
jgi:hypothetical protein